MDDRIARELSRFVDDPEVEFIASLSEALRRAEMMVGGASTWVRVKNWFDSRMIEQIEHAKEIDEQLKNMEASFREGNKEIG